MATSAENRRWPNLFIAGAPRCGTTTIYESLKNHPDVYFSAFKEPLFFAETESHPILEVIKDEAEYLALFAPGGSAKILGEASTGYLADRQAYERIKTKCTQPKFVFVLRDPVERAYSHYRLDYATGVEPCDSFWDALMEESATMPGRRRRGTNHLLLGMYAQQLPKFFETFGRENVRIYLQEDLRDDRAMLENICGFLEIPFYNGDFYEPERAFNSARQPRSWVALAVLRSNKLRTAARALLPRRVRSAFRWSFLSKPGKNPPMQPREREFLAGIYRQEILNLEELIRRDLSGWMKDWEVPVTSGQSN